VAVALDTLDNEPGAGEVGKVCEPALGVSPPYSKMRTDKKYERRRKSRQVPPAALPGPYDTPRSASAPGGLSVGKRRPSLLCPRESASTYMPSGLRLRTGQPDKDGWRDRRPWCHWVAVIDAQPEPRRSRPRQFDRLSKSACGTLRFGRPSQPFRGNPCVG